MFIILSNDGDDRLVPELEACENADLFGLERRSMQTAIGCKAHFPELLFL